MSLDAAFGFQSQTTKALAAIDSTKYPDTNKDFQANLIRLNQFVDYIASYLQTMQKGIDKNNQDPIAQIQGVASDLVVLLGGGELLYGIDLGDLQYFLPAIGALLGFDTTTPFPINLFNAAEHFLLGYVVPLDSFATVIEGIIDGWAVALGIDQSWIDAINELLDAFGGLYTSASDLLTSVESLFNIIGTDFPFIGNMWHLITTLLGGFSLDELGSILDPAFKAAAPWIETLAEAVEWLNQIIESFAGGVTDVQGILNFSSLFSTINFLPAGGFHPIPALTSWIQGSLKPTNLLAMLSTDLTGGSGLGLTGVVPLENIAVDAIGAIIGGAQLVIDAILSTVGFPTGSGTPTDVTHYFTDLLSMLGNPNLTNAAFSAVTAVTNFINNMLAPTNLLPIMNPVTKLISSLNIPGLDASKITSGQFPQSMVNITSIAASIVTGVLNVAQIPGLDASKITSGQFAQSMVNLTNIPASIVSGVLGAGQIPGLDASKIVSGILGVGQIPNLPASIITSGTFPAAQIPGLDASKIITGQFAQSMVNITNIPASIVSGILGAAQIPGLDASKITTGQFAQSMVNITSIAASIVTGVLGAAQIPGLDASKIITGQFAQSMVTNLVTDLGNRVLTSTYNTLLNQLYGGTTVLGSILAGNVPALDASKITTGILGVPQIPNLPASIITSGSFPASVIPGLDASKITSGVFTVPLIPPLDASQIQSGIFGQWVLPNISVGSIGQTTPNLLANPNYASAVSVVSNPDWVWVSSPDHTGDGSGSVRCIANGNEHDLLSDPPTPVAPSQTLSLSHWLQWSGVTGSGACFQLSVLAYNGASLVSSTPLQTVSGPAASGGWTQLAGTYTVPSSGVTHVRLELQVLVGATTGTTYWDDGSITKTQLLQQNWMTGTGGTLLSQLNTMVTNISAAALQTDVMSLVNNLGLGSFASVSAALSTITSRLQGLPASGILQANFLQVLDATKITTGVLGTAQIPLITAAMAPTHAVMDDVVNGIFHPTTPTTGNTPAQMQAALQTIPHTNVTPVLQATDIGQAIQDHVDKGVQAINNLAPADAGATGNSLQTFNAALKNALVNFLGYTTSGTPTPGSLAAIARSNNAALMNSAVSKPLAGGVDPSSDGPFDLALVMQNSTLPVVNITSAASAICWTPTPAGGTKQSIRWLGYISGTITGFYVNVYKLDKAAATSALVYASADIHTSLGGGATPVWNSLNIASGSYINSTQGDIYTVEMVVVGSGSYNVVGAINYLPALPGATPPKFGATRSGATGSAPSSLPAIGQSGGPAVATPNYTPWIGLAGTAGQTQYPPVLVPISATGSSNFDATQYPWANYFDVVIAGGGGAGRSGSTGAGYGGSCAGWATATYTKAAVGGQLWTFNIGTGGFPNQVTAGNGASGGSSTCTIPGQTTLTAIGGPGATSEFVGQIGASGQNMPTLNYNDHYGNPHSYPGGNGGYNPQDNGGAPGGGGAGGNSSFQGHVYGGWGGNGYGWVYVYQ